MILLIILFILAIPLLLIVGFFNLIRIGFENLGIAPELVIGILILMLIGSLINIPLGRRRISEVEEVRFFGMMRKKKLIAQGLSINVGGAIIPILISIYLLTRVPLDLVIAPVLLMIGASYYFAKFIPGKGIVVPSFLLAVILAITAFALAEGYAPLIAFIAGSLGVLIGADLLHLPRIIKEGQGILSIGGAGVFDGIFLIGIISALLAGL